MKSFRGDAKVTGSDTNEVALSGQKSIRTFDDTSADAANTATRVEIVTEGNTVLIRSHQDRANSRSQVTSNLELTVPKGASLEMVGTRGDLDATGLAGDVTLSSENAGVRLQDIGGSVKVETRRSDVIRCENIKGEVELRGRGDDVDLYKVKGQVSISGDYRGSVALRELAQPVRVSNTRTKLDVQQIPGEDPAGSWQLQCPECEWPAETGHSFHRCDAGWLYRRTGFDGGSRRYRDQAQPHAAGPHGGACHIGAISNCRCRKRRGFN